MTATSAKALPSDAEALWQSLLGRTPDLAGVGMSDDTRTFSEGMIFAAIAGQKFDPRSHLAPIVSKKPAWILIDNSDGWQADDQTTLLLNAVAWVAHPNLKPMLGFLADRAFNRPSESLKLLGVTGTNGKTSIVWGLSSLLTRLQYPCGMIGTLGVGSALSGIHPTGMTTPSAVKIQAALHQFVTEGLLSAAIEATSIALIEHRLRGCRFFSGIFTNLSRDHLDYHQTWENYRDAKQSFFTDYPLAHAIININDPIGAEYAQRLARLPTTTKLWQVAFNPPLADLTDNLWQVQGTTPQDFTITAPKLLSTINPHWGDAPAPFQSSWIGRHNVENLALIIINCALLGFSASAIGKALTHLSMPIGRLQQINVEGISTALPEVWVDYAHTPDALEKALQMLHHQSAQRGGKLWCVFGCGGNRDRGKRPLMGEVALRLAHRVVVTSDNPRHEDPLAIIHDIYPQSHDRVRIIADRALAIAQTIANADANDVILIAGKGHEQDQEIGGIRHAFSDQDHARRALTHKGQP